MENIKFSVFKFAILKYFIKNIYDFFLFYQQNKEYCTKIFK